ncbi:DUF3526 domain-containing protein [Mucilaginibacter sp. UYCu711]|uniref:DUF3526 domain-containing protein n=1 Tax=Mucilaginibacter sp. UYCu711 TaxID=3156339 RepID=UPI003D19B58F
MTISCLWIFCLFTGLSAYRSVASLREKAEHESRAQWLTQDRKHPHIAAHFGNFAFKQVNPLSIFDSGTDEFTGSYVYMEAHRQNDVLFSPAQSGSALVRFGTLNAALLLQVIVPLLLILLTFNTILQERLNGTLVIIKSSGISSRRIVVGKIAAPLLLAAVTLAVLHLSSIFLLQLLHVRFGLQDLIKLVWIYWCYMGYYLIITTLGVYVSAFSETLKGSLTVLLGGWIMVCILTPKIVANLASAIYPLPSNTQFKEAVMKDIVNGIDGHNTSNKRAQDYTREILKKYGVDSTSQLPVNIEGLIMLEGEKYSSKVYNDHFDVLTGTLLHQQKLFAYSSLIDPLLAVKNLSMGLSNTDYFNDRNFRLDAEKYRMVFVQTMNEDMVLHSKEDGFTTYKIGKELFKKIPAFVFRPQPAWPSLRNYGMEVSCLLLLMLAATLLVNRIAYKL